MQGDIQRQRFKDKKRPTEKERLELKQNMEYSNGG